uniref:Uncharacterized protein n=1 Tax=Myoviridae sp. ctAca11 TaxID=2825043 RepID=A0A8S5Q7I7_9CAUD|nr:MAG TPA: hypothetical protein [Myoviridae sp. ctAca11]
MGWSQKIQKISRISHSSQFMTWETGIILVVGFVRQTTEKEESYETLLRSIQPSWDYL